MEAQWHEIVDTEAGMLSGISRKRSMRSKSYWFTEFCNSQCLSHFAAPFIVVRAETSVAESCSLMHRWRPPEQTQIQCISRNSGSWTERKTVQCCTHYPRALHEEADAIPTQNLTKVVHSECWIRVNDPSAGSPTETLLRLLLPLSDKVH